MDIDGHVRFECGLSRAQGCQKVHSSCRKLPHSAEPSISLKITAWKRGEFICKTPFWGFAGGGASVLDHDTFSGTQSSSTQLP